MKHPEVNSISPNSSPGDQDSLRTKSASDESRQRLLESQKLVQTSLDGYWEAGAKDGRIIDANAAFCNIIGYSREELLTKSISDLEANETQEETSARIKKIMKIGYDRFETRHRHKLGHLIDLEVSTSYSDMDNGIFYVFVRDITERKRTEIFKQSILNAVAAEVAVLDRNGVILSVNQPWQRFSMENGIEPGKPAPFTDVGDNYLASCQTGNNLETDGAEAFNGIHGVLDGRFPNFSFDYPCHSPQQQRWFHMTVTPLGDSSQNGVVITHTDITERKKLEMEILEHRKEMEHLQKRHIATQTAVAIAHELNQPLLAIASYSQAALMLMNAEKPNFDKIRKAIEGSERQAHRAGKSIRELLDFLRMKDFPTEVFDLNKEIMEALDHAKLELKLQFSPVLHLEKIPFVQANRTHVQKVLLNIFQNSIDAMYEADVAIPLINVTARSIKDESFVQVTIQDNGVGVKNEDFKRLFEPFYTTKPEGIGMGLAISRSLIEENGGQLWADPQEGSGAIFHLTLPIA